MAAEFRLNTSALDRALRLSPVAAEKAATTALSDIKDDWVADSVDAAPIAAVQGGNLRRQIEGKVIDPGASGHVLVRANAKRSGFNYAYYIHEDAGRVISGEKKFLDKPLEANKDKYRQWLEDELKAELRRVGW